MIRYFKFIYVTDGYEIYDFSRSIEHCKVFDPTIWSSVANGAGADVALQIYNQMYTPQLTWLTSTVHKQFLVSGPSMPIPIHKTTMEEGTTIDFWFQISSSSTDATWTLNLYSYTYPFTVSIYFLNGNYQNLYMNFNGAVQTAVLSSALLLNTWYYYAFTYQPYGQYVNHHIYKSSSVASFQSFTQYVNTNSPLQYSSTAPTFSLFKTTGCATSCPSFAAYVREFKIWDTWRSKNSIFKLSKTDFYLKTFPAVIAYWRFVYEVETYGRFLFDYSKNGNSYVDVSSTTSFSGWNSITPVTLCTKAQILSAAGACVTETSTLWSDQPYMAHSYFNSSNFLLSNTKVPSWEWTAEFWMLKDADTDYSMIFYNPPNDFYIDFNGGVNYASKGWFGEVRNGNFYFQEYEYCFRHNLHDCQDSTNCAALHNYCNGKTLALGGNNATTGCLNRCERSTNCPNQCLSVSQCRTICDASTNCQSTYDAATNGEISCVGSATSCSATFQNSADDFKVDCTGVSTSCAVTVTSSNNIIATINSELNFNTADYVKCDSGKTCSLSATTSRDIVYSCQSVTTSCTVTLNTVSNRYVAPYFTYNVVFAQSSVLAQITATNSDLLAVNCLSSTDCQVTITSPKAFGYACSQQVFSHINAASATSATISIDSSSGTDFSEGIFAICDSATCTNTINKSPYCPSLAGISILQCGSGSTCTNTCKNTHQCSLDCSGTTSCTNSLDTSSGYVVGGTNYVYPQILCSTATGTAASCVNTIKDTQIFWVKCLTATKCQTTLTGTTASTDAGYSSTYVSFSYVDCQGDAVTVTQCQVTVANNAYVFIDATNSVSTSTAATQSSVTLTSTAQQTTAGGLLGYPVIWAKNSVNFKITATGTANFFADCYGSIGCSITSISTGGGASTLTNNVLPINCSASTSCTMSSTSSRPTFLRCDSANTCTASITNALLSISTSCTGTPKFNQITCASSTGVCSATCSGSLYCSIVCTNAQNCQNTLSNSGPTASNTQTAYLPLTCSAQNVYSYLKCDGTATCTNTVTSTSTTYIYCTWSCTNSLSTITATPITSGASTLYTLYPYIDCLGGSCTNTVTNVDEFIIVCNGGGVSCSNTYSATTVTSLLFYTSSNYNSFSIIYCQNSATCSNSITNGPLVQISCTTNGVCTQSFTTVPTSTATSGGITYRAYPVVDCSAALSTCTTTVTNTASQGGVYVKCSNSAAQTCSNTFTYLNEFYVDCGSATGNCVVTATSSASTYFAYTAASETLYSIVICRVNTCSFTFSSTSMVYVLCMNGPNCYGTYNNGQSTGDSQQSAVNMWQCPFVSCNSKGSGLCQHTFNNLDYALVDCQSSYGTACRPTLNFGYSGWSSYDSYINCISSTGCQPVCQSLTSCIVDCQASSSCSATVYNTDHTNFGNAAQVVPAIYCQGASNCRGICSGNTDCVIYGQGSTGTYTVSSNTYRSTSSSQYYSVIYVPGSSTTNDCTSTTDCYIICTGGGSCTNYLSSSSTSSSDYQSIDCYQGSCTNYINNAANSYIRCYRANYCSNNIQSSSTFNGLYPVVDCTYTTGTCYTYVNSVDGTFLDCSHASSCSATITNTPRSGTNTGVNTRWTYLRCNYGTCNFDLQWNANQVIIDCSYAVSCTITSSSSQGAVYIQNVYISCKYSQYCNINIYGSSWSNTIMVDCQGATGPCYFYSQYAQNLYYNCADNPNYAVCRFNTWDNWYVRTNLVNSNTPYFWNNYNWNSDLYYYAVNNLQYSVSSYGCCYNYDWWSYPVNWICWDPLACLGVTRSWSSYSQFRSGITLVSNVPETVSYLVNTRLPFSKSIFAVKKAYVYTKNFITASKKTLTPFFNPFTVSYANGFFHPPFKIFAPVTGQMTAAQKLTPVVTYTPLISTIPMQCYNQSITNTNLYSSSKYVTGTSWNHVVLQSLTTQKYVVCLNLICSTMDLSGEVANVNATLHGLSKYEIRFFYTYKGKITEYKLWSGSSTFELDLVRHFYKRRGPYSAQINALLTAYYQFIGSTVDTVLFDYQNMKLYSASNQYMQTQLLDATVTTQGSSSTYPTLFFCEDGTFFDGVQCSLQNVVIRAQTTATNNLIYTIDFAEPVAYSLHYWVRIQFNLLVFIGSECDQCSHYGRTVQGVHGSNHIHFLFPGSDCDLRFLKPLSEILDEDDPDSDSLGRFPQDYPLSQHIRDIPDLPDYYGPNHCFCLAPQSGSLFRQEYLCWVHLECWLWGQELDVPQVLLVTV